MNRSFVSIILIGWVGLAPAVDQPPATTDNPGGRVTLPLSEYQALLERTSWDPRPAPSDYAIGRSELEISFTERDRRVGATVRAQIEIETFTEQWTSVPVLGPGAALEAAAIDAKPVQLVQRTDGFYWLSEKKQRIALDLVYHGDARHSERTWVSALPVPPAAATGLKLTVPRRQVDLSVAPATNLEQFVTVAGTTATATLPPTATLTISWRVPREQDGLISRAAYSGKLAGGAIAWRARFEAEALADGELSLPLLATDVVLVEARVDAEPASVYETDGRFAVRLRGAGRRVVEVEFISPVGDSAGVPATGFAVPPVPVSRFDLELPGDKELRVEPAASVVAERTAGVTRSRFFLGLSDRVAINWMEAVPADVAVETRAHAGVYQALHATEGVLYGQARIVYEFTRGSTSVLEFTLPSAAQVNRVGAGDTVIADWTASRSEDLSATRVRVYLDRAIDGEFALEVGYEQLLERQSGPLEVPLLRAAGVARQNGMLALLAGPDLALAPELQAEMAEVGENQLPAFFRSRLAHTVSHTFKYHGDGARLSVRAVTPERRQGKFNARIDTLVSIGEVTLKGAVGVEADVKSGELRELNLTLPADLNVLGVNGPSIRNHTITTDGDAQRIAIEFTQEMTGQFRIELNYERIMLDGSAETEVPWVAVEGADVEHGRVAIEALAALEVQPGKVEQLSTLEVNELPRQLILKTTNPILLAYKYVRTEKPIRLQLTITRHQEIDVQVAAIDAARYRTLYTRDGLAVTRAVFEVRNSRRQFLRLALPADASIWSVFVNGRAQKPAFAGGEGTAPRDVLIKMVNSANAFPVELIYAVPGEAMAHYGTVSGRLPRPDMIVTHTDWEVFVPRGPRYATPKTNMDLVSEAVVGAMKEVTADLLVAGAGGEPLRLDLPTQGLVYRFAKLYANQAADDARFSLRYVDQAARTAGTWLSLLSVVMLWGGIALLASTRPPRRSEFAYGLVGLGAITAVVSIGRLGAAAGPPAALALATGVLAAVVVLGRRLWRRRRA